MIRLTNIQNQMPGQIESDKIVSVKVIERSSEKAVVDVNGVAVNAKIESNAPDRFLAYVERQGSEVRLRVLKSFKNSVEFSKAAQTQTAQTIRSFLMEHQLPVNESTFSLAWKLFESGVKLSKEALKLLQIATAKYGADFAEMLMPFFKARIALDDEWADFAFHLKKTIRVLMQTAEDSGDTVSRTDRERSSEAVENLRTILQQVFQDGYRMERFHWNDEDALVQSRREKEGEKEIYRFDLSSDQLGTIYLRAERTASGWDIAAHINKPLYEELESRIEPASSDFQSRLSEKLGQTLRVRFLPLEDEYAFYKDEEKDKTGDGLRNLDIFV